VNFTGVKVFSATKAREREELGDQVTQWIRNNPNARIIDKIVTQSSDREFHCLTITIFYEQAQQASAA
jgi:putative lipoic acid-binding regulatory protein